MFMLRAGIIRFLSNLTFPDLRKAKEFACCEAQNSGLVHSAFESNTCHFEGPTCIGLDTSQLVHDSVAMFKKRPSHW